MNIAKTYGTYAGNGERSEDIGVKVATNRQFGRKRGGNVDIYLLPETVKVGKNVRLGSEYSNGMLWNTQLRGLVRIGRTTQGVTEWYAEPIAIPEHLFAVSYEITPESDAKFQAMEF